MAMRHDNDDIVKTAELQWLSNQVAQTSMKMGFKGWLYKYDKYLNISGYYIEK